MNRASALRAVCGLLVVTQLSGCAWLRQWTAGWHGGSAQVPAPPLPPAPPAPKPPVPEPKPGPGPGPERKPEPEPEPEPKTSPEPAPPPPTPGPPRTAAPVARAVPGRPGFVFSPFNNKLVDVSGIPSGRLVADPHYPSEEKKYFRVP